MGLVLFAAQREWIGNFMEQKTKILVVDDTEMFRMLIRRVLSDHTECEIMEVESGLDCLRAVERSCPDVILLDLMMPGMDGIQVLENLRTQYNAIQLPIIMVTSKSEAEDVVNCLKKGANDFVTKPVHHETLVTRLNNQLLFKRLSVENSRLKEIETHQKMVATYNHEINNPLAIALNAAQVIKTSQSLDQLKNLEDALWRISEIVKKIEKTTLAQNAAVDTPVPSLLRKAE